MALIKCPECGKEISSKAESCPNCGCPMCGEQTEISNTNISSVFVINGVQFDIKELQGKILIQTVAQITKKVKKLCKCEQSEAEKVVYRYFLSTHGENLDSISLSEKINHIKSLNAKKLYCPYCLSRNIDIKERLAESVSKGRTETRKKSPITIAGNRAGRALMIGATGGLWALTSKKSDYNDVSKKKTKYHSTVTKTCMDCGRIVI